jgi:virginiamycin B lyase
MLFKLGDDESAPVGITSGADGNAWFIEQYGKIGFISPGGKITEFVRPNMGILAFGGIVSGPDGAIWFTQGGGNGAGSLIGRMSLKGDITAFPLADKSANPVGITAVPDGSLWFAELQSNKIGRITQQGSITEYSLPEKTGGPDYIVSGVDRNLWFSSSVNNYIGRIIW